MDKIKTKLKQYDYIDGIYYDHSSNNGYWSNINNSGK